MSQIELPVPLEPRRPFAWYPEIVWPYESAWSLLHKYCRWNATLQWEVWRQFAHPSALGSFITERVNNLVLLTPGWIDVSKFEGALSQDVRFNEPGSSFISHFINRPPGRAMVAVCSSSLRYCQACIEAGYHSTLFQLRCVQSCPVHALPLREQCSGCNSKVPYKLPRGRNPAYGCECGREFSTLKLTSMQASLDQELVGRAMWELALSLVNRRILRFRLASHHGLSDGHADS